jgi:hypothetical protein
MEIIGVEYKGVNKYGDFNWMINRCEYSDALFLFNDNEEYHNTSRQGRGNAIIRKYNKHNLSQDKPHSAGIPTGTLKSKGYTILDHKTKKVIDRAFDEIIELLKIKKYKKIYYSIGSDGKLGTNIFVVNQVVINYIDDMIKNLKC